MQSEYKTPEIIASKFNWDNVFLKEQTEMTTSLNYNFRLLDIQNFLKIQSKNFTVLTPELKDLDRYMYSLYQKATKPEPIPVPAIPEPTEPAASPEEKKKKMQSRVNLLKAMQKKKPSTAQAMRIKLLEKMLSK